MKRFVIFVCVFVLSVGLTTSLFADAPAMQTYTQRDGLADDYVTAVSIQRDGTRWLGTARGLTRIQDQVWFTFTDANGLNNSWVSAIATSDNQTYIATHGGGLTIFDGATSQTLDAANSKLPSDYLTAVAIDLHKRVWVGTEGYGVARLDGNTWTRFSLANNYINAMAFDAKNQTWVATNGGAFVFDGQAWTPVTSTANKRVSSIALAPDGKVWLGTHDGVMAIDGNAARTYTKANGLADNDVRAIAVDAARVWIGTARGLSLFENNRWQTYTRANGLADDQVNALAIDAQKNLWIGTPRGLSIMGNANLQRATSLPVVLVHGWHTADSDQLDDTEFRFLRKYLQADGIQPFYAQGISPNQTLFQNAARLRDVIADVKKKTGASQVDILAFSMGGLNTRAYLESTLYQNDVHRAIILGTPQAGVQMWYPLLTREIEDRPTEPSVIELSPEYAGLFNRTHQPRATIPYDLLIGDAREQAGLDLLKQFPANDGLIDVFSAHDLAGVQVRRETNSDVHAWNPAPLVIDLTAYLYPIHTYEKYLRNALRDPNARPIGEPAKAAPPIQPRNITPMNIDTMRAGETITRTLIIDANRTANFIARWSAGDVDVKLRAPNGTLYASDTVSNSVSSNEVNVPRLDKTGLLDATYLKADIGNFIGYSIPRAITGTWTLTATRRDKTTGPITLTTYADLDADLKMNLQTDRAWYPPGAPVTLEASLSNQDLNTAVRAKIQWLGDGTSPRGAPLETSFTRQNEKYFATLTNLSHGGYYLARVTARGANYAREREIIFAISPNTATFAGKITPRATPSSIALDVPVTATRPGEFAIGVTLRGAKDELISSLTTPLTLKAGTQNVTLEIPGREIRARGIDGAYNVDLILMDTSWAAVQVDEIPTTPIGTFRASDFGN